MRKVVDWFWDGILLKEVHDKTVFRLHLFMYWIVFVALASIVVLFIPTAKIYVEKGITDLSIWSGFLMIIILLVIISSVLFSTIRRYRDLK